jgi:Strictosidine synthase/Adipocyte plasma membrane-associated protein-like, N-terminal
VSRPPISPISWHAPSAPARARATRSQTPLPQQQIIDVAGHGPEDTLIDQQGRAYTGTSDGLIRRITLRDDGSSSVDVVADTGGRPLGLEWLPDGRMLVCDAIRGLLAVELAEGSAGGSAAGSAGGSVESLAGNAGGEPLIFTNNAAVAPDGTIWFSDSSARFGVDNWRAEIFEHSGTGRLIRRDPDGTTQVVLSGLQFANGVALAADGSAVFVAETSAYQLSRVLLTGPRAGEHEVVVGNLPGFPDNISRGSDGLIWVAMASPRDRIVDLLAPAPAWVRKAAWAVPEVLQPKPKLFTWVQAYDPHTFQVVHDLQGKDNGFGMSTGVREQAGRLWLGSLVGTTVATFELAR